ncbi:hypothetical protein KY285_023734 [Solanum tuberosum]|nr:hypothetical protein KY289_024066 [Solanum tuberosum]KAH0675933.1 hypothetical protein KY285_023734 [Solanum tuberosum]
MVFESAVQFRKAVQSYAVENKVQLELKPNEKHKIRVKCKSKILCKWEIYASTDRNSGDFIMKKYHLFHRCPTKNKNRGWLERCRKIIVLDGWFLKGLCKGELLVTVGRSGNNEMFPIAWAVVDQETKHSWTWFIEYLISNLELGNGVGFTIISDCQKGLFPTIQ